MNWTEESNPIEGISHYDHTILKTPIGDIIIEWKGWKESPSYDIMLDNIWIGCQYSLDDAKEDAETYIKNKHKELGDFLDSSKS